MAQDNMIDFGTLYRAAYAERNPERKQILLSEVQKVIRSSEPEEVPAMIKLAPQSTPKVSVAA